MNLNSRSSQRSRGDSKWVNRSLKIITIVWRKNHRILHEQILEMAWSGVQKKWHLNWDLKGEREQPWKNREDRYIGDTLQPLASSQQCCGGSLHAYLSSFLSAVYRKKKGLLLIHGSSVHCRPRPTPFLTYPALFYNALDRALLTGNQRLQCVPGHEEQLFVYVSDSPARLWAPWRQRTPSHP